MKHNRLSPYTSIKHNGNHSSDLFSLWNLSMYFINDLVNFLLQRNNSCATVACWHMGRKLWTHILQSDKVCKRKRTNDFVFLPFDIKELSKWKEKIQIPYFILCFQAIRHIIQNVKYSHVIPYLSLIWLSNKNDC